MAYRAELRGELFRSLPPTPLTLPLETWSPLRALQTSTHARSCRGFYRDPRRPALPTERKDEFLAAAARAGMWQIAFVVAVLASIFLLRLYAEKGTPVAIMIPVLISWSLGFFFFLVLPFDLEHALCRKCRDSRPPEEKDECACLAGDGGMHIAQLKDLIPAAYT